MCLRAFLVSFFFSKAGLSKCLQVTASFLFYLFHNLSQVQQCWFGDKLRKVCPRANSYVASIISSSIALGFLLFVFSFFTSGISVERHDGVLCSV